MGVNSCHIRKSMKKFEIGNMTASRFQKKTFYCTSKTMLLRANLDEIF